MLAAQLAQAVAVHVVDDELEGESENVPPNPNGSTMWDELNDIFSPKAAPSNAAESAAAARGLGSIREGEGGGFESPPPPSWTLTQAKGTLTQAKGSRTQDKGAQGKGSPRAGWTPRRGRAAQSEVFAEPAARGVSEAPAAPTEAEHAAPPGAESRAVAAEARATAAEARAAA